MHPKAELSLLPKIDECTERVIREANTIKKIHAQSPGTANLVFPQAIIRNYRELQSTFTKYGVSNCIQFAHKPNKSLSLASELAYKSDGSIDIASVGELASAKQAGFSASRICASGPKNDAFLNACVVEGVAISIDSLGELQRLIAIVQAHGRKRYPIFIRVNVESLLAYKREGRFGVLKNEIAEALSACVTYKEIVLFKGFAFHLNFDAKNLRKKVFSEVLHLTQEALRYGLSPTHINVGGGFRINYIQSHEDWHRYTSEIKRSVLQERNPLGWDCTQFGYWSEQGTLRGVQNYMELYEPESPAQQLDGFLNETIADYGMKVYELLHDFMLTIIIEPGRALLDSAGVTVTSIVDIKKSSLGNAVLIVDMNRSQIGTADTTYMVDPILLPALSEQTAAVFPAFIAGNLCLDADIICKHLVHFSQEPKIGDLLLFANTAAYFMDFTESHTLQQPIAPKTAVWLEGADIKYAPDAAYVPEH